MMKKLVLLFLVVEVSFVQELVGACSFTSRHVIYVRNDLPRDSPPLKIHCASKNNDLGNHDLYPNQNFHWKFCANFFPSTLYFCHFWWGSKNKSFDVYKEKLRSRSTYKSWWVAKSDGIYFGNQTQPTPLMKKHDWNN